MKKFLIMFMDEYDAGYVDTVEAENYQECFESIIQNAVYEDCVGQAHKYEIFELVHTTYVEGQWECKSDDI